MRASPQHGSPAFRFSAPLRNRRDARLLLRAKAMARRPVAGRRARRGRARAAGRAGRGGRGDPRSRPHSRRARRFQAADGRRSARSCSTIILAGARRLVRLGQRRRHRPHQHPARRSLEAMRRAAAGWRCSRRWRWSTAATCRRACPATAEALVKGDQRSQSIAAASIVAKVMRDRMMASCGRRHLALRLRAPHGLCHRCATARRSRCMGRWRGCTG